jgi:uncharacterized coiled-coil DUF342 family protein
MTVNFANVVASAAPETTAPISAKKFATPNAPAAQNNNGEARRPNPLKTAFDKKMLDLDRQIKTHQSRINSLKSEERDDRVGEGDKEVRNLRASLITKKKELFEKRRVLESEKDKIQEEINGLDESAKKQNELAQAAREKLPFKDIAQIERAIRSKEQEIESGRLSLKDEKTILQDISKLHKSKKLMDDLERNDSALKDTKTGIEMNLNKKKALLNEKYSELKAVKSDLKKVFEQLDATELNKEEAEKRKKRADEEIVTLKSQIDVLYKDKHSTYQQYQKDKETRHEAFLRSQARREEFKKRNDLEDKIDEVYKKLRAVDPSTTFDKRLNECVNLTNYFGQFVQTHGEAKIATSEPVLNVRKPEAASSEEYDLITPKADRTDIFLPVTSKSQAKKSTHTATESTPSLPKLPLHILAGLADLGYAVPKTVTESKDLLVQLGRRRDEIDEERTKSLESIKDKQKVFEDEIADLKEQLSKLSVPSHRKNDEDEDDE